MNKVFNYIRVSSKEQNEARQIKAMQEFNKANNIDGAIELIDKSTGTNTDRDNLQLLLKVVGEGDLVVIKSIDRLSRNYKECKQLWEEITGKGADIVVIDMPMLDTRQYKDLLGSFISDLIISVLGYVAEQETEFRKQRQAEGIAIAKEQGKHLGRPKAEYPNNWQEVYEQWKQKEISGVQAMEQLGLKKTTFYKLVKQYENNELKQEFMNTKYKDVYGKDLHKLTVKELKQRIKLKETIIKEQQVKKTSGIYKEYEILVNRLNKLEGAR